MHTYEMHAHEMHAHKRHAHEMHTYERHAMRCTPLRGTPMECTPMKGTPMIYKPMRGTPMRCTPMRCMSERCMLAIDTCPCVISPRYLPASDPGCDVHPKALTNPTEEEDAEDKLLGSFYKLLKNSSDASEASNSEV
jgi:hypothetical protein